MHYNMSSIRQFAIQKGYDWVKETQALYQNSSRGLEFYEKEKLKNWFSDRTLDNAKIATVICVENPPFFEELKKIVPIPFDYKNAQGVTFGNLILMASLYVTPKSPQWLSVLFHELVHVVQSDLLGTQKWAEVYVDGAIANDFRYEKIPLEVNAYSLQKRFSIYAERYFSVDDEVKSFLGSKNK